MVVKILKSDNPKRSYANLTFEVLKSMKFRIRLSKFVVYHWVNSQLGKNHQNYTGKAANFGVTLSQYTSHKQ